MPLCLQCEKTFPNRVEVDGKIRNMQRRKYCLECSPFGEHNTKKIHEPEEKRIHTSKETRCLKCGNTAPDNFYGTKKHICKQCHNKYTHAKGKEKRMYALEKLGGKCVSCGFNKYPCSLDIHHTDPSIKDEHFKSIRGWSLERIDREMESCVLLCRNCHSAYHSGYDITFNTGV